MYARNIHQACLPPPPPSVAAGNIIDGKYVVKEGVRTIAKIGQLLYACRVVTAESCLIFARSLLAATKAYANKKTCWGAEKNFQLSTIPQLRCLFQKVRAGIEAR